MHSSLARRFPPTRQTDRAFKVVCHELADGRCDFWLWRRCLGCEQMKDAAAILFFFFFFFIFFFFFCAPMPPAATPSAPSAANADRSTRCPLPYALPD